MIWVGRDLKDQLVPTPLPWAGTSWNPHVTLHSWLQVWLCKNFMLTADCLLLFMVMLQGSGRQLCW